MKFCILKIEEKKKVEKKPQPVKKYTNHTELLGLYVQ